MNQTQKRELDLKLAGPEGLPPSDIAAQNRAAMAALGQVGQVKARRKKKP